MSTYSLKLFIGFLLYQKKNKTPWPGQRGHLHDSPSSLYYTVLVMLFQYQPDQLLSFFDVFSFCFKAFQLIPTLVSAIRDWHLFLLSLDLTLSTQNGHFSPLFIFFPNHYPIQCFFDTHTICNYVYLIYCLCPPLVPWEEGPCSSYFPVYFMVLSKNGHSKFWMNG